MHAGIVGLLVLALAQPTIVFAPPPRPHAVGDGVIQGRVLSERGEPLAGVLVQIGTYDPGARDTLRRSGYPTLADERGYYEIVGVAPGDWIVNATGSARRVGRVGRVADTSTPTYRPTYFPGVAAAVSAQVITVRAGETIQDVNFSLQRAP